MTITTNAAPAEDIGLGADLVEGIPAIAEYLFGRADRKTIRRTYYLAERRLIPLGKMGEIWIGSRRQLREHMAAITGAAA